jgi:hypothetical protein
MCGRIEIHLVCCKKEKYLCLMLSVKDEILQTAEDARLGTSLEGNQEGRLQLGIFIRSVESMPSAIKAFPHFAYSTDATKIRVHVQVINRVKR